jgi:uncharacterized membrane protein YbhN (UPF0104 family)
MMFRIGCDHRDDRSGRYPDAVANWLLDAACLWMCCTAVGADGLTATQLVIAYCAGMAAASVPGGLGIVDGALVLGLVAGGLTSRPRWRRWCSTG